MKKVNKETKKAVIALSISELTEYYKNITPFQNLTRASNETGISYLGDVGHSAKSEHGQQYNIDSYIVYLSPYNRSGFQMCKFATKECIASCLNESGHNRVNLCAGLNTIDMARIRRTILFNVNPIYFLDWIAAEITVFQAVAAKSGHIFSARLNGTSDIPWELVGYQGFSSLMAAFPTITWYDYTKIPGRKIDHLINYSLTFSYTGRNTIECLQVLENQGNVAIVFNTVPGESLPSHWKNYTVLDGDVTDYRPADCKGCVVGLRYKVSGKLSKSDTYDALKGNIFVVDAQGLDCQHVYGVTSLF
jgi:hypothetical protein